MGIPLYFRDLAARNILVDAAGVLKVADFGLSRAGVYVHTRSNPVPLRWLAPEAILHSQYCNASDVWAFAVLLWEIATLGESLLHKIKSSTLCNIGRVLSEGGIKSVRNRRRASCKTMYSSF